MTFYVMLCGEKGIRTPGTLLEYTRFPSVPLKPLEHLSNFFVDCKGKTKIRNIKTKNQMENSDFAFAVVFSSISCVVVL